MISNKNKKIVRDLTRLLFVLRVIPFTWSPAEKMYKFSPQRVYFSYLHVIITLSHLLLCLTQLSLCSARIRVCYAFEDGSQVAIGHNMMDKFVHKMKRNYLKKSKFEASKSWKILDKLVPGVAFSMILVGILNVLKCWLLPDLPVYFTSFVSRDVFRYASILRFSISLFFSYFIFCSALLCSYIISKVVSCMPIFVILMSAEFRLDINPSLYVTQAKFRASTHLTHLYRQLEILLNVFLDIYGFMILPSETFLTLAIISYNSCLILYRSYLNSIQLLSVYNGMLLAWSILTAVFEIGGRFDLYSRRTLTSWKRFRWSSHSRTLQMSRFARSCRPLKFSYKDYRLIKRGTLLCIVRSIAVSTFRVVKMLRK